MGEIATKDSSGESKNRGLGDFQTTITNNKILTRYLEAKFSKPTVETVFENKIMINNQTHGRKFTDFSGEAQKIITCMVSSKLLEKAIRTRKSTLTEDDGVIFERIIKNTHQALAQDNINLDKSENNYDLDTSTLENLEASLIKINTPYLPEKQERSQPALDAKTIKEMKDKLLDR